MDRLFVDDLNVPIAAGKRFGAVVREMTVPSPRGDNRSSAT